MFNLRKICKQPLLSLLKSKKSCLLAQQIKSPMAATRKQRIIYTAISATIIVIISSLYRYKPNILKETLKIAWNNAERMNIAVINNTPKGSGMWVELLCKEYIDKDTSVAKWTSNVTTIEPGQQAVITVPEMRDTDVVEVLCKYRGGNGCQAENLMLFENPCNDVYYCSESMTNKCTIIFQADGSVNKIYENQETIFLGYLPTPDILEKCLSIGCLLDPPIRMIGKSACCGDKCTGNVST